jgi:hypothetical protein
VTNVIVAIVAWYAVGALLILSGSARLIIVQSDRQHIGDLIEDEARNDRENPRQSSKPFFLKDDCAHRRKNGARYDERRPREADLSDDETRQPADWSRIKIEVIGASPKPRVGNSWAKLVAADFQTKQSDQSSTRFNPPI